MTTNVKHAYVAHENCEIPNCMICDGGLALCGTCGGLEGSLTTECPGVQLSMETLDKVYKGELDFKDGQWVSVSSVHSPAHYRQEGKQ